MGAVEITVIVAVTLFVALVGTVTICRKIKGKGGCSSCSGCCKNCSGGACGHGKGDTANKGNAKQ